MHALCNRHPSQHTGVPVAPEVPPCPIHPMPPLPPSQARAALLQTTDQTCFLKDVAQGTCELGSFPPCQHPHPSRALPVPSSSQSAPSPIPLCGHTAAFYPSSGSGTCGFFLLWGRDGCGLGPGAFKSLCGHRFAFPLGKQKGRGWTIRMMPVYLCEKRPACLRALEQGLGRCWDVFWLRCRGRTG